MRMPLLQDYEVEYVDRKTSARATSVILTDGWVLHSDGGLYSRSSAQNESFLIEPDDATAFDRRTCRFMWDVRDHGP